MLRNCDVTSASYERRRRMARVVARGHECAQPFQISRLDADELDAVVAMDATGFLAYEDDGASERECRAAPSRDREREVFTSRESLLGRDARAAGRKIVDDDGVLALIFGAIEIGALFHRDAFGRARTPERRAVDSALPDAE